MVVVVVMDVVKVVEVVVVVVVVVLVVLDIEVYGGKVLGGESRYSNFCNSCL